MTTDDDEYARICEEIDREERAIRESGVCPDCGAVSAAEAAWKCQPRAFCDTGDYTCAAETWGIKWTDDEI